MGVSARAEQVITNQEQLLKAFLPSLSQHTLTGHLQGSPEIPWGSSFSFVSPTFGAKIYPPFLCWWRGKWGKGCIRFGITFGYQVITYKNVAPRIQCMKLIKGNACKELRWNCSAHSLWHTAWCVLGKAWPSITKAEAGRQENPQRVLSGQQSVWL